MKQINEAKRMQQLAGIKEEFNPYKDYALYLDTHEIYSHLPVDRLKSVLKCLVEELNEDLEDYYVLQNKSGNVINAQKMVDKLGWDLSKAKPFDNISSLQNKIKEIENTQ